MATKARKQDGDCEEALMERVDSFTTSSLCPLEKYNSLLDTNLAGYFSNPRKLRHLQDIGLITKEGEIVDEVTFRLQVAKKEQAKSTRQLRASAIIKMAAETEKQRTLELRRKLEYLSKMERVERIKQQRQHPKGIEEDFDPYCSDNTTVRDNPHPRHSRPQSSMDILHQRLGVTESEFALYHTLTKPKVVSRSLQSPYSMSAGFAKPTPPSRPKPLSKSLPAPKRRATFKRPLTSHDTSKLQGQPELTLQYTGPSVNLEGAGELAGLTDVVILQQHCGGNTVCVFKGKVKPKGMILFTSRRHRDCPFGISLYTDGMIDTRLSTCCEYRHKTGRVLGCKSGHFKLVNVSGGKPCYKCQVAEEEESKLKHRQAKKLSMLSQQKSHKEQVNGSMKQDSSRSVAETILADQVRPTSPQPSCPSPEGTDPILAQGGSKDRAVEQYEKGSKDRAVEQYEEGSKDRAVEQYEEEFEGSDDDHSTVSSTTSVSSTQSSHSEQVVDKGSGWQDSGSLGGTEVSDVKGRHEVDFKDDDHTEDEGSAGRHGNIQDNKVSDEEHYETRDDSERHSEGDKSDRSDNCQDKDRGSQRRNDGDSPRLKNKGHHDKSSTEADDEDRIPGEKSSTEQNVVKHSTDDLKMSSSSSIPSLGSLLNNSGDGDGYVDVDVKGDIEGDGDGDVKGNIDGDGDGDGYVDVDVKGDIEGDGDGDVKGNIDGDGDGYVDVDVKGHIDGDGDGSNSDSSDGNVDVKGDVDGGDAGNDDNDGRVSAVNDVKDEGVINKNAVLGNVESDVHLVDGSSEEKLVDGDSIEHPYDGDNDECLADGRSDQHAVDDKGDKHPVDDNNGEHPDDGNNDNHPDDGDNDNHPGDGDSDERVDDGDDEHLVDGRSNEKGDKHPIDGNNAEHSDDGNNDNHPDDGDNDERLVDGRSDEHPVYDKGDEHQVDGEKGGRLGPVIAIVDQVTLSSRSSSDYSLSSSDSD